MLLASFLTTVTASAVSTLAEAGAPVSHEPQLLDIDATVLIQLAIFLVLMAVLTARLWKPYLKVRAERVSRVEGYRRDAERLEAEAAARLDRAEAELASVRRIGSGERAVARAEAHAREQTLIAEAQAEAQRKLAAARAQIDATLASERAKLDSVAREIARQATRQVLGREVAT